jgi:hypothetical protein
MLQDEKSVPFKLSQVDGKTQSVKLQLVNVVFIFTSKVEPVKSHSKHLLKGKRVKYL